VAYTPQQIESLTADIRELLGHSLLWKYEVKFNGMLSEFAQNKSDAILESLREIFEDEWDAKTVKKVPKGIKIQLGNLAKITKKQKLLALPATEKTPAIVALWWPWDHGGTYSLRFKILKHNYDKSPEQSSGLFSMLKRLFNSS